MSCKVNNVEFVNLLLHHGYTNVDHRDSLNKKTGYEYLTEENKKKVREYIEKNGLKVKKPEIKEEGKK